MAEEVMTSVTSVCFFETKYINIPEDSYRTVLMALAVDTVG
jgi:hypothetical protein